MAERETAPESRSRHLWRWATLAGLLVLVVVGAASAWPWMRATNLVNAGRQALDRGDMPAAIPELEAAARIQPKRAEIHYLLAVAYRRSGKFEQFRARLQTAHELGWSPEATERQEWLAAAQTGDVDQVRQRLLKIIDRGVPDEIAEEIYEAMSRGYLTTYRMQDAWRCLGMWLKWSPDAPHARLMRGYIYEQLDQVPSAIEDYRAALERLPDSREAHLKLAELLLRQGAHEEAKAHFHAGVGQGAGAFDADAATGWLGAARCAQSRGDLEETRRCLTAALALRTDPLQHGHVLAELGRLLLKEGQTAEALEKLSQAVRLAPSEVSIHRSLAAALTRAGQAEQAKVHFDLAREIEAQCDRVGDIQKALIEKPLDADLRCEAGKILIAQGLDAKGLGWLQTALKCDPNHREAHRLLAEHYATVGDQTRAAHHRLLAATAPERKPERKLERKPAGKVAPKSERKPEVPPKPTAPSPDGARTGDSATAPLTLARRASEGRADEMPSSGGVPPLTVRSSSFRPRLRVELVCKPCIFGASQGPKP